MKLAKTFDYCESKKPVLTVALIHGIASDSATYKSALDYLCKREKLKDVRFVTFDLLGSGQSPQDDNFNYDYKDQLEALDNALSDLDISTPLILVGHSLGTFIVTKYTSEHPKAVSKLVLISPPIYTEADFDHPAFEVGIEAFKKLVRVKDPQILEKKAFNNSMEKIVLDRENYERLVKLKTPTILIYGNEDQLIASYNVPKVLKQNEMISAIRTLGKHGVSRDKYTKLAEVLEEVIDEIS